jgi:hypothetical protein
MVMGCGAIPNRVAWAVARSCDDSRGGSELLSGLNCGDNLWGYLPHLRVDVNLVGYADDRDAWAVLAQLLVPRRQILVRLLARDIEAHHTGMRHVVICGVHRIKSLLRGRSAKSLGIAPTERE